MELSLGSLNKLSLPRIVQPAITPNSARPLVNSSDSLIYADSQKIESVDSSQGIALIKTHTPIKTPKSETTSQTFLHSVSSTFFDLNLQLYFETKPSLDETPKENFKQIFVKKCLMCCQMCNFKNEKIQIEEKKQKTELLEDLLCHMGNDNIAQFTEVEYKVLYKLFIKNIVRTTPEAPVIWFAPVNADLEVERVEECGWPHMSLVYDILTSLFQSPSFKASFCPEEVLFMTNNICQIFQSPDSREREKLIKLFHAFYKGCNKQRHALRKKIASFLDAFIDSPYPIVGVNEMMMVNVPILSGFKLPLHQEHIDFFKKCLMPLHRSPIAISFHAPLLAAVTTLCSKQPSLVSFAINYLAEHWPQTTPTKEVLFLTEIENLLPFISSNNALEMTTVIIKLVARCVNSIDFAVAERALMMWQNEIFAQLIVSFSKVTYPILLPALFLTANGHWCTSVCNLAVYVLRALKGSDLASFNEIGSHMKQSESERILKEIDRGHTWKRFVNSFAESEQQRVEILIKISKIFIGNENVAPNSPSTPSPHVKSPIKPHVEQRVVNAKSSLFCAKDPILSPKKNKRQSLLVKSVVKRMPASTTRQSKRLSDVSNKE